MKRSTKYGKHTLFLGASFLAHLEAQHDGERGHLPERTAQLLPGETARKRFGIPMFMGEVTCSAQHETVCRLLSHVEPNRVGSNFCAMAACAF